jgi:hypothetical protein
VPKTLQPLVTVKIKFLSSGLMLSPLSLIAATGIYTEGDGYLGYRLKSGLKTMPETVYCFLYFKPDKVTNIRSIYTRRRSTWEFEKHPYFCAANHPGIAVDIPFLNKLYYRWRITLYRNYDKEDCCRT